MELIAWFPFSVRIAIDWDKKESKCDLEHPVLTTDMVDL